VKVAHTTAAWGERTGGNGRRGSLGEKALESATGLRVKRRRFFTQFLFTRLFKLVTENEGK